MKYLLILIILLSGCTKKHCKNATIIAVNNSQIELNIFLNHQKILNTLRPGDQIYFTTELEYAVIEFLELDGDLYHKEKGTFTSCETYYFYAE